jgi:hypothetical protein
MIAYKSFVLCVVYCLFQKQEFSENPALLSELKSLTEELNRVESRAKSAENGKLLAIIDLIKGR